MRVAIIGAGMAGILSAIKLTEAGFTDVTVYEKADRLGGTWRENTYPGIACDVPSHLYSYSFHLNPGWSHPFSPGHEIQAYLQAVARDHRVDGLIRFGEEVTTCTWTDRRWHLDTAGGAHDVADFVIAATGVLHHPNYPDIKGLDAFEGNLFHSSRWDHDVTIEGARVGIVGTGSTAVQLVSAVVEPAQKLSLFQRTAQWIMPQENPPYREEEQAEWGRNPDKLQHLHQSLSELFTNFANGIVDAESPEMAMIADMCRQNLESKVTDPELRERLRPNYRAACKRLVISPNFYESLQRDNAELVTEPIDHVEADGIRTVDGRLHALDVVVLATGFKVDAFMRPMSMIGRDGQDLAEVWADRPNAYLSISIPEFPNFAMVNGPNGPVGNFSLIEVAEMQVGYILQLIDRVDSGQCREISVTQTATDRFEATRVEAAANTIWSTGCQSWYLDDRGIPATWPWSFGRFSAEMERPKLDAFDQRP
ncbi:MAG TPA: NAD(P)/FAD-dependent oxidoreductase [Acidimicrobiales bacterium]|jgi:cation diffusion facilitator CzcD-associated flavoprotein CzcO|nr:NAD(P)/FAD-dependent oxidoreductase [Acidimicrobiales bacterium]